MNKHSCYSLRACYKPRHESVARLSSKPSPYVGCSFLPQCFRHDSGHTRSRRRLVPHRLGCLNQRITQVLKDAGVVVVQVVVALLKMHLLQVEWTTTMIPLGEASLRMSRLGPPDRRLMLHLLHWTKKQLCPVLLLRVVASWSFLDRTWVVE